MKSPPPWVAAERVPEFMAVHPDARLPGNLATPPSRARAWTRDGALVEIIRGRLSIVGPVTSGELAESLAVGEQDVFEALLALESEGVVLRFGKFLKTVEPGLHFKIPLGVGVAGLLVCILGAALRPRRRQVEKPPLPALQ